MSKGLGRGLGSLIPKKTVTYQKDDFGIVAAEEVLVLSNKDRVLRVDPSRISINPQQPRTDFSELSLQNLAESIKQHGILQPLIVTKKANDFELIAGERRLRSAKLIGLTEVPVIVRSESNQKKLELALIENLQREDLNPIESARAYKRLIDEFNITQNEAAHRLGQARSSVTNSLRLLSLPIEIQEALASAKITGAHAKYLLGLEDKSKQLSMLKKILRYNLSVAQTNKEIRRLGGTKKAKPRNYLDQNKEEKLAKILNTKVELKRRGKGGKIIIDFYSDEELTQIMQKIK